MVEPITVTHLLPEERWPQGSGIAHGSHASEDTEEVDAAGE